MTRQTTQPEPVSLNPQTLPVSPQVQIKSPAPSTIQTPSQNLSPTQPQNSKGKLLGLVLSFFITVILIAAIGGAYYFWLVPQAKAKEYISNVGADIASIHKNLKAVSSIFVQTENPLEKPEEALNEITLSRNYTDAQKDTKEDIAEIKKSLDLIKTAGEQKAKIQIRSKDINELNGLVEEYLSKSEEALKSLLAHQEFQQKLLNAYGDNLETELLKVDEVLKEGFDRKTVAAYFQGLSQLSKQSSSEMNLIPDVPPEEAEYFAVKKEYLDDLSTTSDLLAKLYEQGNTASDKTAQETILDISERNKERNDRISKASQDFVANSTSRKKFDEAKELYKKITDKINELKVKYKVEIEIEDSSSPLPESTTSAIPQATSSATDSAQPQATKSATTSARLNPQPR